MSGNLVDGVAPLEGLGWGMCTLDDWCYGDSSGRRCCTVLLALGLGGLEVNHDDLLELVELNKAVLGANRVKQLSNVRSCGLESHAKHCGAGRQRSARGSGSAPQSFQRTQRPQLVLIEAAAHVFVEFSEHVADDLRSAHRPWSRRRIAAGSPPAR